jgi:hypothetical protein
VTAAAQAPRADAATRPGRAAGVVSGGVRTVIRLEGLAILAVSCVLFAHLSGHWVLFAMLFLAPDLAFIVFFAGPRAGAFAYNLTHSLIGPAILALVGVGYLPGALPIALIWIAHIGFDRCIGYGLKYSSAFGDTHLGLMGRGA